MKKGIYLLAILLFPSIIYMLFSLGEHHVEKLGFYGDYELTADGDTLYRPVPDVTFVNQKGEQFQLSSLEPKVLVLNLYESPCDSLCKKRGATLANYLNELSEREKWSILNISLNPADVDVLGEDAEKHNIGMENWWFVAPEEEQAFEHFLNYIFVETKQAKSLDDLPGNQFVLLDQGHRIRSFFDSRTFQENRKIEDAVKLVLTEPYMSWKEQKNK